METIPSETRRLRACLLCNLIKVRTLCRRNAVSNAFLPQSLGQFKNQGCDNCDAYLRMKGSVDRVYECTTTAFSGMVGSIRPQDASWACKWLRIDQLTQGVYAVSVQGRLPEEIQAMLEQKGLAGPAAQHDHFA